MPGSLSPWPRYCAESASGAKVGPPVASLFSPTSDQSCLPHGRLLWVVCAIILMASVACARGSSEVRGWKATQPGMELSIEGSAGPQGEAALALLYTVATGTEYAIERPTPIQGLDGRPSLSLKVKATRVLHLALVLVDQQGVRHESARTLVPGDWRELRFDDFQPPVDDWEHVAMVRLVDLTGELGGQGPVSLKLVGLPL